MNTDNMEFDSDKLINFLKFSAATVELAGDQLGGIGPNSSPHATAGTIETAITHLTTVSEVMRHLVGVHCPHCAYLMDRYTDGRQVTGHINFPEGTQFVQVWHPLREHSWNRPREACTITTRNGTRKRIVVSAPGHLDAFTVTEQ
jgi:hypothetical protein